MRYLIVLLPTRMFDPIASVNAHVLIVDTEHRDANNSLQPEVVARVATTSEATVLANLLNAD